MVIPQYWEFPPYRIIGGKQCYLEFDDGRSLVDLNSGYWQYLFGYRHEDFLKILCDPDSHRPPSTFISLHEEALTLNAILADRTGFPHVQFNTSGSGAVDTAVRMVDQLRPGRKIISLRNAFHGSNATALMASGFGFMRKASFVKADTFVMIEASEEGIGAIGNLARKDEVSCVILEPIQGVGGCYVIPHEFLADLFRLRREHDFLIIADEISTFARTGEILASKEWPSSPDIVCLGKGISGGFFPISLVLATDEVLEHHQKVGNFFYGNTLAATPLACKLVMLTFKLLFENGFTRIRTLSDSIEASARKHALALRGRGIMCAIDLGTRKDAETASKTLADDFGLFSIPEGRYLSLMPSLEVTERHIEDFFSALSSVR